MLFASSVRRTAASLVFTSSVLVSLAAFGDDRKTDEIVVTATKREMPLREIGSSVSVLDGVTLDRQGYQFVADALRQVPGVQIARSGGAGQLSSIFLRGEESYRTLVLVDGLEISDISAPQTTANLAHLLVGEIERIEVVRGPQGLLYGADAIGGVVSITTKRGEEGIHPYGSVEYGSFDTVSTIAGLRARSGMVSFNLSGQYFDSDGFSAKEGDPTLDDKDGYENKGLLAHVGLEPSEDVRFDGLVRYSDARSEFDGFSFDPDRELFTEEVGARVAIEIDGLSDRMTSRLALSRYQSNRADYDNGSPTEGFFGDPQSRFDGRRDKAEFLTTVALSGAHTLLVGADYETEEAETDVFHDRTGITGAYAEWQASFDDALFLTGGARFDHHEDFGDHVSYRATGAYLADVLPLGETKLRVSLGTGFRAPSLNEQGRNATFGLPPLEEERSRAWDVGIDQSVFKDRGRLDVTYFHQIIEDEIRFDNLGFTGYFQSSGTSVSRGIETQLTLEPIDGLTFVAAYTFTDATVNSPDAEDGLPRVRRPKHMGNFDIAYVFPGDGASLGAHVRTAAKTEDGFLDFRVPLDDYIVVDINVSLRVVEGLNLKGRVENIFNEQYQEIAGFATPDAAAFVGIEGSF